MKILKVKVLSGMGWHEEDKHFSYVPGREYFVTERVLKILGDNCEVIAGNTKDDLIPEDTKCFDGFGQERY